MELKYMSSKAIAMHLTAQGMENELSMLYDDKKLNNQTHKEILRISQYVSEKYPESKDIVDELLKIDVPEAQVCYVRFSVAYGYNTQTVFPLLKEHLVKYGSLLQVGGLLQDVKFRLCKYGCYMLPNIDQKHVEHYDKALIEKYFGKTE